MAGSRSERAPRPRFRPALSRRPGCRPPPFTAMDPMVVPRGAVTCTHPEMGNADQMVWGTRSMGAGEAVARPGICRAMKWRLAPAGRSGRARGPGSGKRRGAQHRKTEAAAWLHATGQGTAARRCRLTSRRPRQGASLALERPPPSLPGERLLPLNPGAASLPPAR